MTETQSTCKVNTNVISETMGHGFQLNKYPLPLLKKK